MHINDIQHFDILTNNMTTLNMNQNRHAVTKL